MSLIGAGTRRPIAVAMLYCVVAALGLYFFNKLPLEQLPNTNLPGLQIRTSWPYASPESVEAFVSSPIEGVSNTLSGVKEVQSVSREGESIVEIEFTEDTDIDFAMMDLNEKLTVLEEDLPEDVSRPKVVIKSAQSRSLGITEELPLSYYMTGNYESYFLREYAEKEIETALKGLRSVSDVEILGGQPRMIKIEIDRKRAEMYGVNEYMITNAIDQLDIKTNAGYVYNNGSRFDILVDNRAKSIQDVRDLRIRTYREELIPITQVAEIKDDFMEPYSYRRINGNPKIAIDVFQKDGTNTLEFVAATDEMIEKLRADFPPTLEIIKDFDPGVEVNKELVNIKARAIFCILVIFAVLYLFLRNLKVPVLILSTIFFSELITIILFYVFDIGFNIMTIAGLALGFGMLVDSSIVVLDNIFRYRELDISPPESAERGAKEVFMPILASVLTTSIVFIPFLYLTGDNRLIYVPLAMAVVFSLIASVVVAFTFIPTFALKAFSGSSESINKSVDENKFLQFMINSYGKFIEYVIKHKYWTLITVFLLFAGSSFIYTKTSSTFTPYSRGGESALSVYVRLPVGAELERSNAIAQKFEEMTVGREYIKKITSNVSSEVLRIRMNFTDEGLNTDFPNILKDELTSYAATFAGVSISVQGFGDYFSAGGFGSSSYNFTIDVFGYNYQKVDEISENLGKQLRRFVRIKNIDTKGSGYRTSDIWESVINIKREQLSKYDLTVRDVVMRIDRYLRGGSQRARIKIDGEEVNFAVKVKAFESFQLEDLQDVMISSPGGDKVRLTEVAEIDRRRVMMEIKRNKQQYERSVKFEYRGPYQLGKNIVESLVENYQGNLPPGYTVEYSRREYDFEDDEEMQLWLVILFAVLLVYMVTASLYESLLHPFTIILTVPMALIGVFLTFFFAGQQFNRSAYIGVILLAGIVVNNSIILVDHINLLRRNGMELYSAVIQGCKDRVRPILMTSMTTIMGLLPLIAFSSKTEGLGRDWYLLSLASIGGLLSATPLTLSVIPVLYILFEEWQAAMKRDWRSSS